MALKAQTGKGVREMRTETKSILWILGLVTMLSAWRHAGSTSPDLLASWMAGLNFARDMTWNIYYGSDGLFTMRPPDGWVWELKSNGHESAIYPFIYPPLWAWVMSKLTFITSFEVIVFLGNIVNPLLMMSSILLAARMASRHLTHTTFLLIGVVALGSSVIAIVALEQNQPQIFVSFLLVLAAERTLHGDDRTAGLALALAASIKLYPAVFAVIWLAQRNWTALTAFTLFGGALGLASIAVAGWPLHAAFLHELSAISATALVTFFTHSLDPTIAELFFKDQMTFYLGLDAGAVAGWTVLEKPPIWRAFSGLMMVLVIAGIFLSARRDIGRDPLFWPVAFVALALVSPLSWGYHYLSSLVFLPVLIDRLGLRWGALGIFAVLWPTSVIYIVLDSQIVPWASVAQPLGTFMMAAFAIALTMFMRSDRVRAPVADRESAGAIPAE